MRDADVRRVLRDQLTATHGADEATLLVEAAEHQGPECAACSVPWRRPPGLVCWFVDLASKNLPPGRNLW